VPDDDMADEAVYTELEELARVDGVPTGRLVREALGAYVAGRLEGRRQGLPDFVGMVDSGDSTLASQTVELIADALAADHARDVGGSSASDLADRRPSP